jgi:hypothetical protein
MRDMELELENTHESNPEAFLGGLLGESEYENENFIPGLLGEGEGPLGESEYEYENFNGLGEGEGEGELELEAFGDHEGEFFFKKLGSLAKKYAPLLKSLAKKAAPIVGAAIGGPIGSKIAGTAANLLLKEGELEGFDHEFESEGESEAEMETVMEGPLTEQQALGELMAAAASKAVTDMEAEAQVGASVMISLTPQDRDALRAVLPSLNRGVAVLTRVLRSRPETRPVVRVIPTVVKRTAVQLRKHADAGRPVTRTLAARTMANQTRRVLSSPAVCNKAMQRNVRATQAVSRKIRTSQPARSRYGY